MRSRRAGPQGIVRPNAPATLIMTKTYSSMDRFDHEQSRIRKEIQVLLTEIGEKAYNRTEENDGAVAELLRQLDILISTARGATMRLKECKRMTALVDYMIEQQILTQGTYASTSTSDRRNKNQARRD